MISPLTPRSKGGGLKNSGVNTEEEEATGETVGNRVVGGQMVQKIKGQADGRGLEEGRQVDGEETGGKETLNLEEVGGEMGEAEVEATQMRDLPGGI